MVKRADRQIPVQAGTELGSGRGLATPRQLVESLQSRDRRARDQFWALMRPALERLIDRLVAQHQLKGQHERLVLHALHTAETWLRTRPPDEFDALGWRAFQAALLVHVTKMSATPFGQQQPGVPSAQHLPLPLPDSPGYHTQTVFLPFEQLGDAWFGGDWYGGARGSDGSLWLLLADITGHGYHAHLLASALPSVFQMCWPLASKPGCQPADLLAEMHHLFEDCFPEGVYVEATLVRLDLNGVVTVAPAGGSRLLLHRTGTDRVDLISLRGAWLGLAIPSQTDQRSWALQPDDELILGTDGLFDQLAFLPGRDLPDLGRGEGADLFGRLQELLQTALTQKGQHDDITVVALRRLAGGTNGTAYRRSV